MEDLRDVEAILSQTASTNLESAMLKGGYDKDLARDVFSLQDQSPGVPLLFGFAHALVESGYHLQLETC
jgi:hypothetical protein